MDDGGCEVDHRLETAVCFVASHCYAFEFLQLAEEILDQMAPLVNVLVDVERLGAALMLRDYDLCPALVHVFDDPVGIKGLEEQLSLTAIELRRRQKDSILH